MAFPESRCDAADVDGLRPPAGGGDDLLQVGGGVFVELQLIQSKVEILEELSGLLSDQHLQLPSDLLHGGGFPWTLALAQRRVDAPAQLVEHEVVAVSVGLHLLEPSRVHTQLQEREGEVSTFLQEAESLVGREVVGCELRVSDTGEVDLPVGNAPSLPFL